MRQRPRHSRSGRSMPRPTCRAGAERRFSTRDRISPDREPSSRDRLPASAAAASGYEDCNARRASPQNTEWPCASELRRNARRLLDPACPPQAERSHHIGARNGIEHARRWRSVANISRYESSAHERTIGQSGARRSGRRRNLRLSGAPDVCVRSGEPTRQVRRVDAERTHRSSRSSLRSSAHRSTMAAVIVCVNPSALKGVSARVAIERGESWRP